MNYQYLKVRTKDRVGWIEYNRPPINAFNWEMLHEVPATKAPRHKERITNISFFQICFTWNLNSNNLPITSASLIRHFSNILPTLKTKKLFLFTLAENIIAYNYCL